MENNRIKFEITDPSMDSTFDEKGNTFLAMRKVLWGDKAGEGKLELRKWYVNSDGTESPNKGFSFLTEDGPNALVKTLLENNFGHTREVLDSIKTREDFNYQLVQSIGDNYDLYGKVRNHIGHHLECVRYGKENDPDNVSIECTDCNEVIFSMDRENSAIDTDLYVPGEDLIEFNSGGEE